MHIIDTIKHLKKENSNLIDVSLQFIRQELNSILKDVAKIHLISAEQALISASTSNNSETETRVAIGHLRDAFNSFQVYLEKGTTVFWIFPVSWRDEETTDIQFKLSSIAIVIALIYEKLNDINNYISWKNTGLTFAKLYIANRPNAIAYILKARKYEPSTGNYTDIIGRPDYAKRSTYKDRIAEINLFSEILKVI